MTRENHQKAYLRIQGRAFRQSPIFFQVSFRIEALYIAQCLKNNQYVKYNDAVTYHNGIRALDSLVIEPASVVDRYNVSSFMMVRQLFGNQFASL